MIQQDFANRVIEIIRTDPNIIGLAAAGSWITNELDEFSDLDLVLVTKNKIAPNRLAMQQYAEKFGELLSSFTGEHVGEPRVLICMYDNPLLHVDIKFLTLPELSPRVENPIVLFERENQLSTIFGNTEAQWPFPDYQWIEDRFWTWIHYLAGRFARGEFFEVLDGIGFIRLHVLAPLLSIKNKNQPRGLRKVEMKLSAHDLDDLKLTVATYDAKSILSAVDHTIRIYRQLRKELFSNDIELRASIETKSIEYLESIRT